MQKKKVLTIGIIILVVLAGVLLFIFLDTGTKPVDKPEPEEPKITDPVSPDPISGENVTQKKNKIEGEELDRQQILTLATTFMERMGNYSNHGKYESILTAKILATEEMSQKIDQRVTELSSGDNFSQEYRGVSGILISKKIESFDAEKGIAEVDAILQREENNNGETSVAYKEFTLEVIKNNNKWLVDSVRPIDQF